MFFKRERAHIVHEALLPNEIRLIRFIELDAFFFTIELVKVNIERSLEYDALSYTWGSPPSADTKSDDDGDGVVITPNLESALTRYYRCCKGMWIWVDALCINQNDDEERSKQVFLMTQIYQKATMVFIWLGDDDDDDGDDGGGNSSLAFTFLMNCADIAQKAYRGSIQADIDKFREQRQSMQPAIDAVKSLLLRPYWSRLWIIQEVTLARRALISFGDHFITWTNFQNAFYFMEKCGFHPLLGQGHQVWSNLNHLKAKYGQASETAYFELGRMLLRYRGHMSSDPRDKIFGLLGVANERVDDSFQVDYQKTTPDVFTHFTRQLLIRDQHLDLLGAVTPDQEHADLPSWVPDWSTNPSFMSLSPRNFDGSASYSASGSRKPTLTGTHDPNSICLRGVIVDEIQQFMLAGADTTISDWVSDLEDELGLPEDYPHATDQTSKAALFLTLAADLSPWSRRVDDGHVVIYFPEFLAWASTHPPKDAHMPDAVEQEWADFITQVTGSRAIFATTNGYIGLAPKTVRAGDLVCVLLGGNLPFVLRRGQGPGVYRLVGESYVHGIMDGEALQTRPDGDFVDFVLV